MRKPAKKPSARCVLARITRSARQTGEFGRALAVRLVPGDCVCISGPLGAGKTTLVRGALRRLGVRGVVPSPTFILANEVRGRTAKGRDLPIAHLDFYRLTVPAVERGLLDYLDGKFLVFVEWAERDRSFWPRRVVRVRIRLLQKGSRSIRAVFPSFRGRKT